jgi:hypothetical protein
MGKIRWTNRAKNEEVLTLSQGRKECPTYNKTKKDQMIWSHLASELSTIEGTGRPGRRRKHYQMTLGKRKNRVEKGSTSFH